MEAAMIAVYDSDSAVRSLVAEVLSEEGYEVKAGLMDALAADMLVQRQPDLLVIELASHTEVMTLELLKWLHEKRNAEPLPVVVTTTDFQLLERLAPVLQQYGCAVVCKPFTLEGLTQSVRQALLHRERVVTPRSNEPDEHAKRRGSASDATAVVAH